MNIKQFSSLLSLCLTALFASAQVGNHTDTVSTEKGSGHLFLKLEVPKGDFTLNSSGLCGHTVYKVFNKNTEMAPAMNTRQDASNNLHQDFALVLPDQLQSKNIMSQLASSNLEPRLIAPAPNKNEAPVHTLYCPDPSIPTDLTLNIGHGHSRLDLSDMTINRLSVESHFAEIFIQYNKPNRMPMEKMHVQAIQGKIVLKNLEQAHADLVTIENEMDLTKIMIGNGKATGSTVHIQQGIGDCELYIHPGHPLKIVIREGFFSSSALPQDFEPQKTNVFVNQAWMAREVEEGHNVTGTTIICSFDVGKLRVTTMR